MTLDDFQFCLLAFATPYEDVVFVDRADILEPGKAFQFEFRRRNLGQRIPRATGLRHPYLIEFSLRGEVHPQRVGLGIIHDDDSTILLVDGIIDCLHIAVGDCLMDFSIGEEGLHLFRRNLIIVLVFIDFLNGECLPDDVCTANTGVVHEDLYLLAQQLPFAIPDDGILIHRHARILRVEDQ